MSVDPSVSLSHHDGIAVVVIDHPPVNALSLALREELLRTMEQVASAGGVTAVVILCAGRTFIAGADIHELQQAAWDPGVPLPDLRPLLRVIEECPKPVVMAIHGTALGGGLEIAMAGHFRIAARDARFGLPEVNLGIIPGGEGTQRLPRLVGVATAIDMIVSGKPIGAAEALSAGLIDRIADGALRDAAVAWARELATSGAPIVRTRDRGDKLGTAAANAAAFGAGREMAGKTRRRQPAGIAAVEAIEAAVTLPFEEGSAREHELVVRCLQSEPCKALIHVFFAERGVVRVPGVPRDTDSARVARVAVIGAGTMGGGIAMACANAGFEVVLTDATREALDRGLATIARNYESSVKRGRLSAAAVAERIGRIHGQVGYDGAAAADVVIEAVFENLALKQDVFGALDGVARPGAVLATNTSTLDIDAIALATARPASVIGLHFFSPAPVMRLVEIVRGRATAPPVIAQAMALARRLGKIGVVVGNGPGFVGNRMMFPYMYEAQFLVEDGATPEQVDRALTDWGMAMGIFAVDDLAGVDVAWRVRQELRQFEDPALRKPLAADRLCEMGRFGQKTGSGWYRYDGGRTPVPDPEVIALVEAVSREAGIARRPFAAEEIIERTIYALINEGARVLEEGLALRAADIDVIYTTGYGFPAFRGGPMFFADRVGLRKVCDRVEAFHRAFGKRWEPAPLLVELAGRGSTFGEYDSAHQPSTS